MNNKIDGVNKPNGCIMTSCNNGERSVKYQKHQNKTDNSLDNTSNSSNHNNKDKNNNLDDDSNKTSNKNKGITMKIMCSTRKFSRNWRCLQ